MIDTTMIRLITGATTHLGDSAKDAFLVWVILDKVLPFIIGIIIVTVISVLLTKMMRFMYQSGELVSQVMVWRDQLGIGTRGHLSHEEMTQTIRSISQLIAERNKK